MGKQQLLMLAAVSMSDNLLMSRYPCHNLTDIYLSVHNLIPHVNLQSHYSLSTVVRSIYKSESDFPISALGPGGGAYYNLGYCCEFMGSAAFAKSGDGVKMTGCACRFAYVDETTGEARWREQENDDRFGLMGNFYLSQNERGKVIKIHVKRRIGKQNYTEAIRAVMLARYGTDRPVSMGGVFYINSGSAKLHVMPKHWPDEPSTDASVNNEWLRYYNITKHPLVCLSVFHSYDPGYNLRMEHTHCYNLDTEDEAGHYHYDITPETVEYEGYFNVAERVYRLDGP